MTDIWNFERRNLKKIISMERLMSVRMLILNTSNGDFKSLISICSFIKMHHSMFFEAGRMSSRLLVFVVFALDLFIPIYHQKTKMALILADKIKLKKFIKKNRNLKTTKLINAIKHFLNIKIYLKPWEDWKKASLGDFNLSSRCKIEWKF